MKKSLITLAVAAGMAASGVANAAPTVYGFIDLSINSVSLEQQGATDPELDMKSNTSAIGVKGAEDLGDGMKAIYKVEFQIDPTERCTSETTTVDFTGGGSTDTTGCNSTFDRDQFVGLKGGMGKVVFGTTSSNYKQMGGKIDPWYRTSVQARSVGQQSSIHKGAGRDGGRMTNIVQYTSPKMGGIQAVLNTTVSGSKDEASGLGIRYATKALTVWLDVLSGNGKGGGAKLKNISKGGSAGSLTFDSAAKIGAKFKATKALTIGAQYENVDSTATGPNSDFNVMFLSATFAMDKNNSIAFTWGDTEDIASGFNLGVWHKMSKKTSVYAVYNDTQDETPGLPAADDGGSQTIALGIRKKF